jgi:hypothetical protein
MVFGTRHGVDVGQVRGVMLQPTTHTRAHVRYGAPSWDGKDWMGRYAWLGLGPELITCFEDIYEKRGKGKWEAACTCVI